MHNEVVHRSGHVTQHSCIGGLDCAIFLSFLAMPGLCCFLRVTHSTHTKCDLRQHINPLFAQCTLTVFVIHDFDFVSQTSACDMD